MNNILRKLLSTLFALAIVFVILATIEQKAFATNSSVATTTTTTNAIAISPLSNVSTDTSPSTPPTGPRIVVDPFSDVPTTHPYFEKIWSLFARDIISGKIAPSSKYEIGSDPITKGVFGINDNVKRQQFAKMIVGVLDKKPTGKENMPFTDVDKNYKGQLYPHSYVALCTSLGITMGVTATKFNPYGDITRSQVATMMVRAAKKDGFTLKTPPKNYKPPFTDFGAPHYENARIAAYNKLFEGLLDYGSNYDFWKPATRGEVAVMLYNLMDIK